MKRQLLILSAIIGMALLGSIPVSAQGNDLSRKVLVISLPTKSTDCTFSIGSGSEQPCPEGFLVWADVMTEREAKNKGINDYTVLTNDEKANQEIREKKVKEAHEKANKKIAQTLVGFSTTSCTPHTKPVHGKYKFSSNTTPNPTIEYNLNYTVTSTCSVINASDQTKSDGTNYPTTQWTSSNSGGTVSPRGVTLSTSYSNWFFVPNALNGDQYQNNSQTKTQDWHYAYGYWYYD